MTPRKPLYDRAYVIMPDKSRLTINNLIDSYSEEYGPMDVPTYGKYVLAEIVSVKDLGTSSFYEVVSHDGTKWFSFAGSDIFNDGEVVVRWKYIDEIFRQRP